MQVKPRVVHTTIPIVLPWRRAGDRQITKISLDGALQQEQLEGCQISIGPSHFGTALHIVHGVDAVVVPMTLCYIIGEVLP